MPKVKLNGYECLKCKHRWVARTKEKPVCCAKCKTPYWDKKRQRV